MIVNPRANRHLSWWSYRLLLAALAVLSCLPSFTEAREMVRINLNKKFDKDGLLDILSTEMQGKMFDRDSDLIYRFETENKKFDKDGWLEILSTKNQYEKFDKDGRLDIYLFEAQSKTFDTDGDIDIDLSKVPLP